MMNQKSRWTSRIVGYGTEAPDQLLANPHNPRRHDRHQHQVMEALLTEVGWVQDVIVNNITGHLIDGHLRVQLALRNGETSIPVKYVELDLETEKAAIATLDAITGLAEVDADAFEQLLDTIDASEAALQGFLDTLAGAGGALPDDRTAGDDVQNPAALPKLTWGGHSVVMSRDEHAALIDRIDTYRDEHGSLSGFVTHLLDGKEL